MAAVFEVVDPEDKQVYALKLLDAVARDDSARTRFRREFRALSRLEHPNILQVWEWGILGDRPWFTMDLIHGMRVKDAVALWSELPQRERFGHVRATLCDAARALSYIHERGMVHRDVTPSNLLVTTEGKTKLMDFGLVKDLDAHLTRVGEFLGTAAWVSPEQIQGEPLDARSDLYSLGAVLYLMLTGQPPFHAHTMSGYMEKHLREVPRPPVEVNPSVPPELSEICVRLLSKNPSDRYASAMHLLHILGDVRPVEGETRWPPRVIGRAKVKARINSVLDRIAHGKRGKAILIEGASGMGKSRVLDLAVRHAKRLGLTVARGRCREHHSAFGAFEDIYRTLRTEDPPEILRATFEGGEPSTERYPVLAAFRDLVEANAPCVVVLDEIEDAEPATLELLQYLIRNTLELDELQVGFILSVQTGRGDAQRDALASPAVERTPVNALTPAEVEELVLSVLPPSPAAQALAKRLHAESSGSPTWIADILAGMLDEGLVRQGERGYELELEPWEITSSRLPLPQSLRDTLLERLAPLSEEARGLGRLIALSHTAMDLDALVSVSQLDEDDTMEAFDELVDAGIINESRDGGIDRGTLSHSRFRDVLLDELDDAERRDAHRRLGETLERIHRHELDRYVDDLAHHFEQAEIAPKAYAYLVRTAERHLGMGLHEEALGFLDRGMVLEPTARPYLLLEHADKRLLRVHLNRARAYDHLGRWSEALDETNLAESLAHDLDDRALQSEVDAAKGNRLRRTGELARARVHLQRALDVADDLATPFLRTQPLYGIGALAWVRGNLTSAEDAWRDMIGTARRIRDERAEAKGLNGLAILALCRGKSMESRRLLERAGEIQQRLGMLQSLAITRANLIEIYTITGVLRRALRLSDKTIAEARAVHHMQGMALGLMWRAQVLVLIGRIDEAHRAIREALRLARTIGSVEDEANSLAHLGHIRLLMGRPESALDAFEALAPMLEETDPEDIRGLSGAWHAEALWRLHREDDALAVFRQTTPTGRQWPHVHVRADIARSAAADKLGLRDEAIAGMRIALESAEEHGYRVYQLAAHSNLAKWLTGDEAIEHRRLAHGLMRSISGSLGREDGQRFARQFQGD